MTQKASIIVISILVAVIVALSVGVFLLTKKAPLHTEKVTGAARLELFSRLMQSNPQDVLIPAIAEKNLKAKETERSYSSKQVIAPEIYPFVKNFNYSYTRANISIGPAVSKCPAYTQNTEGSFETYSYFDEKQSHFKSLSFDKNNNLFDYSLDRYLSGKSEERFEYKGGKYAVKILTDLLGRPVPLGEEKNAKMETGSLSESFKKTENIAATFFGEDATVEKIYEGDKLKHIVFTWEYQTSCSATETLPLPAAMPESVKFSKKEDAQTIVVKSWTNPVTYEVFRQDEYLKKTDKNNLLLTTETETETKKTTFDQVKNVFQFEYNVEVRTIKIEVPPDPFVDKNAYLAQVEKYLKEKALFVLRPASTTAKLDYEYVPFESHSFNYLFDRNFYPEGERGDKAFEQAKKLSDQIDYQTPLLELTFSLTNEKATSLSIAIFDETEAESKILKQYLFMPENIKASNTLVTVDNQSINATKYLVPLKEVAVGSKESATKTEVTPEVKSSLQVVVIFNFAGKKYLINFFGVAKEAEASNLLKFTSFNTNNTQELAQIISEIREAVTQRTQLPGEAIPGEPTQIRK